MIEDLEKKREQNERLEASEEYRRIEPELEREVAKAVVEEELTRLHELCDPALTEHIAALKALLDKDPLEAADAMSGFGRCHDFWRWKKTILKKKYGMEWYSPADLYPECCFD